MSYYDATNGDLKVVYCGDEGCTSGNFYQVVDSAGDVGQYTAVSRVFSISYYDVTNHNLKVAFCDPGNLYASVPTRPCEETQDNLIETVDSAGDVGQYTSLVLDSSENAIVSYYDAINRDLKVANSVNVATDVVRQVLGNTNADFNTCHKTLSSTNAAQTRSTATTCRTAGCGAHLSSDFDLCTGGIGQNQCAPCMGCPL